MKGVENSREEAALEESAGEVDKAMDEGEWKLCVKNLLQVVDGMVSLSLILGLCVVFRC